MCSRIAIQALPWPYRSVREIRHSSAHWLWMQDRTKAGSITAFKVKCQVNAADLFTEHLGAEDITKQWEIIIRELHIMRSSDALKLQVLRCNDEGDHWIQSENTTTRVHMKPRLELFNPCYAPGGIKLTAPLSNRKAEGTDSRADAAFIAAKWKNPHRARHLICAWWVGRTTFQYKQSQGR